MKLPMPRMKPAPMPLPPLMSVFELPKENGETYRGQPMYGDEQLIVGLCDGDVERIARRVVELLDERR